MQTIAEMTTFIRNAEKLLTDKERQDLIEFMATYPKAGVLMPRCGGFRKVRWSRQGIGKSGGVRVIYYLYDADHPLLLTLIYGKGKQDALTAHQEKSLALLAAEIKNAWKG